MVYTEKDMKCLPFKQCYKMIVRVDKVLAREMERQHELNKHLTNWLYALSGIVVMLIAILFVLICNIYYNLGIIPNFGV